MFSLQEDEIRQTPQLSDKKRITIIGLTGAIAGATARTAEISVMTIESAIELLQMMIWTSFVLISPILGTAIAVGLTVSLVQTVTSIQEQTLVFVPKLVGIGLVLVVAAQWLLRGMVEFATLMIQKIPEMTA